MAICSFKLPLELKPELRGVGAKPVASGPDPGNFIHVAMTVRVRIAPSPTGNLHIGTARTAVFNWLFAKRHGGTFILRIEDTDTERSQPIYTENILQGLQWLGLQWDEGPFFQSQRLGLYHQKIQQLLDQGLAYRCYCSEAELEDMRSSQKARKEAPRYDNRHRNLTPDQEAAYIAEGRHPVIRFKIADDRTITWTDLVRGEVTWRGSDLGGDMVIARTAADGAIGQPLYNLAVVVDDIDMQISHVIRGEDHIANTAKQILLYEALGAGVPEFAHTPLILSMDGRKLSKRDGVTAIADFQQMGFVAEAMVNYMTLLGWSAPDGAEIFSLAEAAQAFSFDRVNKAGAKFDWAKLDWLNSQYLRRLSPAQLLAAVLPYWQQAGYQFNLENDRPWLEALARLIGESLVRLQDAVPMAKVFFEPEVQLTPEAAQHLAQPGAKLALQNILATIESQPLTAESATATIQQVTREQGVKKPLVMRSLRAALTGELQGADLVQTWIILNQRKLDQPRIARVLTDATNGTH